MKLYTIITAASTKQFKIIRRFLMVFLVQHICNVFVHCLCSLGSISQHSSIVSLVIRN